MAHIGIMFQITRPHSTIRIMDCIGITVAFKEDRIPSLGFCDDEILELFELPKRTKKPKAMYNHNQTDNANVAPKLTPTV